MDFCLQDAWKFGTIENGAGALIRLKATYRLFLCCGQALLALQPIYKVLLPFPMDYNLKKMPPKATFSRKYGERIAKFGWKIGGVESPIPSDKVCRYLEVLLALITRLAELR